MTAVCCLALSCKESKLVHIPFIVRTMCADRIILIYIAVVRLPGITYQVNWLVLKPLPNNFHWIIFALQELSSIHHNEDEILIHLRILYSIPNGPRPWVIADFRNGILGVKLISLNMKRLSEESLSLLKSIFICTTKYRF